MQAAVSPDRSLVAARRAAAGAFLLNGLAYSNVVPRLPAIKADLGLSNTALGAAIAAAPIGALVAGPLGGFLLARFGSARVVTVCGCIVGALLPLFAVAPAWAALAAAFFVAGAADSLMDVAQNAQALRVQALLGRSIINRMHGLWSVGAVAGGLLGTLSAAAGIALEVHFLVIGLFEIGVALLLQRWMLPGRDPSPAEPEGAEPKATRSRRGMRLALLGMLVVMAAVIEDSAACVGAVFLRSELGSSAALAGLVFVCFQTSMTIGRLTGDRIVDRFGEVPVVRVAGALVVIGMTAGLAIGSPLGVLAGFAVAGLGASPLFPLVFNASANVPGVPPGHGLAAIAWMGRIGFLLAPPIVGALGDTFTLRSGLLVAPTAGLVVIALAPLIATRPPPAWRHRKPEAVSTGGAP